MSLNLHAIVRGAISFVNADEQVYLCRAPETPTSQPHRRHIPDRELVGAGADLIERRLKIVGETERTERSEVLSVQRFEQPNHQRP